MSIRRSSAQEIDRLVGDLSAERGGTCDAAVARLTIIGARAVDRLADLIVSSAPAAARTAALHALDAIGDSRGRATIFKALADANAGVAITAAMAVRGYLRGPYGAEALDLLTRTALDRARGGAVRAAALRAASELDAATIAPLIEALRADDDRDVRAAVAAISPRTAPGEGDVAATLTAAAGDLPADPGRLRDAIVHAGGDADLSALLRIVEAVRAREGVEPPATRGEWVSARAAAHLALARRGSRVALYDLRESLESAEARLPVEFLAALAAVGDASCLEAIAAAHARSRDAWWRVHLADAFRVIVKREELTRRHAIMKKIEKKWPSAVSSMTDGKLGS